MRVAAPLIGSIALHAAAALVLIVLDGEPARPRHRAAATAPSQAPVVEVTPIEVVVLAAPPVPEPPPAPEAPAASQAPPGAGTTTTPPAGAMTTTTASAPDRVPAGTIGLVPGTPVGETPAGPASSSPAGGALSMRRPGSGDVALGPAAIASTLARIAGDGEAPPRDPTTGELRPVGGGRTERNEGVFVARVDRDGTVDLEDADNLRFHWSLPRPSQIGRALGDHLESWARDPYAKARKGGEPKPPRLHRPDFQVDDPEPGRDQTVVIAIGGASFDVNDALERLAGNDPYAARKLDLMDRTRDERVVMGERERKRQRDATEQTVRKHLAHLWARTDLTVAQKKLALFELWDDCAEDGEPTAIESGTRARAQVIGFIRAHLPQASDDAFTAAEIARLDGGRTSRAHFAPY